MTRSEPHLGLTALVFLSLALLVLGGMIDQACSDELHNRSTRGLRGDVLLIGLGAGLDVGSTEWALSHCGSGCREGNPLLASRGARVGFNAAAAAAATLVCHELRRHGNRRAARIFAMVVFVAKAGLAINNIHQGSKVRR